MAIYRDTRYPGRFATRTTNYPQGAFKNKSAPSATDGSYAEQDWLNDWDGFFGRLLTVAGITPNGNVDSANSSQYYDALMTLINNRVPTGMIVPFAVQVTNPLYLLADGSAKSRTTYAALFNVIGTTFGSGDGSTTFNLPDYRAEFLRGSDFGRGIDANRVVGSSQKGSALPGDDNANAINVQTINNISDANGRSVWGYDAPDGRSTSEMYVARTTGNNSNSDNSSYWYAISRPRNVAVAYYIKI